VPETVPAAAEPAAAEPAAAEPAAAGPAPEASASAPVEPVYAGRHAASDAGIDAPVLKHADAALRGLRGWPCHVCGTLVPLEQDNCTECHAPFLAGVDPLPAMALPLVGDPRDLTKAGRFGLAAGGIVVVSLLLLVVGLVLGQAF